MLTRSQPVPQLETLSREHPAGGTRFRAYLRKQQVCHIEQTTASIALSPDALTVAGGSLGQSIDPCNMSVRLWDTRTGALRLTLKGHHNTVSSVCYSPNGNELVSADEAGLVKLWDAKTGALRLTLPSKRPYKKAQASFTSNGRLLATITDNLTEMGYGPGRRTIDRTIEIWDVRAKTLLRTLDAHKKGARCIAISSDGKLLASGGYRDTVQIWDVATGKLLKSLDTPNNGAVSLAFSPSNTLLAGAIHQTSEIKFWNVS